MNIYLYKGWVYMEEWQPDNPNDITAPPATVSYWCMPMDFSKWWEECSKEMYEAAKYYGTIAGCSKLNLQEDTVR